MSQTLRRWIIISDRNSLFNGSSNYRFTMRLGFGPLLQMCSSLNFCWHFKLSLLAVYRGIFFPCFIFALFAIITFGQIENSKIFYKCDWAKNRTKGKYMHVHIPMYGNYFQNKLLQIIVTVIFYESYFCIWLMGL